MQIILGDITPAINENLEDGISFFFDKRDDDLLKIKDISYQLDEIRYQRAAYRFIAKDFVDIFKLKKNNDFIHSKLYILYRESNVSINSYAIIGSSNFTASGLGIYNQYANKELNLLCDSKKDTQNAIEYFKEQKDSCISCKESVLDSLDKGFFHHTPSEILSKIKSTQKQELVALNDERDKSLDSMAEAFSLFDFQKQAAKELIRRLETYGVALLADPVGAGKTLVALALTGVYQRVRIITPAKLQSQWESYFVSKDERICKINKRIYSYHEAQNLEEHKKNEFCDLVIIDESHNFRNGLPKGNKRGDKSNQNRYAKLQSNIPSNAKVLLLSATPINNSFMDLANQFALYKDKITSNKTSKILDPFNICKAASYTLKAAYDKKQTPVFEDDFYHLTHIIYGRDSSIIENNLKNEQGKGLPEPKIAKEHLSSIPKDIDFSYQELLIKLGIDSISESSDIESKSNIVSSEFIEFVIYNPYEYLPEDIRDSIENKQLKNLGEYKIPRGFIVMSLLKSLESSLDAFYQTITKIITYHESYIKDKSINNKSDEYDENDDISQINESPNSDDNSLEILPKRLCYLKLLQQQNGIDYIASLNKEFDEKIKKDLKLLKEIKAKLANYDSNQDFVKSDKFHKLCEIITNLDSKIKDEKLLIFTESIITAKAITKALENKFQKFNIKSINGKTHKTDFSKFKQLFSPKSCNYILEPNEEPIDILVASDVLSEGQNLQDCANLINWDIAFNPVRAIQRAGRIHRIGSSHKKIQITHFFPDMEIDSYIQLNSKLELKIAAAESGTNTVQNPFDSTSKEKIANLEAKYRNYKKLDDKNLVAFDDEINTKTYLNSSLDFILNELAVSPRDKLPNGIFSIARLENIATNTIIAFLSNMQDNNKYYCVRYEMDSANLYPSATSENSGTNLKVISSLKDVTNLESIKKDFKDLESITQDYQNISALQNAFVNINNKLNVQIQNQELSKKTRGSGITDKNRNFTLIAWLLINPDFNTSIWKLHDLDSSMRISHIQDSRSQSAVSHTQTK